MAFQICGLDPAPFQRLFGLPDDELRAHGATRYVVDANPGYPDRIELRDGEVGETVLLLNHTHQAAGPYRSSHAIFVREGAATRYHAIDEVPRALATRLLSVRSFDRDDLMIDADVCEGRDLAATIERFFCEPRARYLHVHFAKRGCFAARIDRLTA